MVSLLEAGEFEEKFTIEAAAWLPIARLNSGTVFDFDGSDGATLCFGDGVFGARPADTDVFQVRHREGLGALGSVPPTPSGPVWTRRGRESSLR